MVPAEPKLAQSHFRTDYILLATTICVCVLVGVVLLTLASVNALNHQIENGIFTARAARDATISLNDSVDDAYAARRAILMASDREAVRAYAEATQNVREQATRLVGIGLTSGPAAAETAEQLHSLTEVYLAELASVTAAQLRSSPLEPTAVTRASIVARSDAMRAQLSARNDEMRDREHRARQRIDLISIALAILAFFAPGLTILAVRRERRLWRRTNELAETARAQAMESDLAKSRFLATASHDMRQPLHAMSLYISALERRVETPEARDILTKMDRANQSLVGMFARLLDLARVQAGAVNLEVVVARVQDVLDRVAAEHPGEALTFARSSALVRTDPVLLERLLGNLVTNALKHGGGKARIELAERADTIDISVADDGPGIDEGDQERIFGEFERLGRKTDGLGLGLAIVRRIAILLEAPLKLVSRPGAGARFTITLPRAKANAAAVTTSSDTDAISGQPILIIDDDQIALEAMSQALSDLGAKVRSGSREADADAALASGFTPRLIVMDLRIDGAIAGIEIARRLRARINPAPAVIIVTGDTGPETLAILKLSGFVWLIKPVNPLDIEQATQMLLSST